MTVHGCIKQVPYPNGEEEDEDEEGPMVFKRAGSSPAKLSSQKHPVAASSLQRREGSSVKMLHNENSESRRNAAGPSLKVTDGLSARSPIPLQSKHLTGGSIGRRQANVSLPKDDDSDDEQPLSSRLNVPSMAVHKNSARNVDKVLRQSSECNHPEKPPVKQEASDDSDDEKPLSSRFSVSSAAEKGGFSNVKKESERIKLASPPPQKMNSIPKEPDDSEDEKPLASRFSLKASASGSAVIYGTNGKYLPSKMKANCSVKKEEVNDKRSPEAVRKRPLGDASISKDSPANKKIKASEPSGHGEIKNLVVKKKDLDDNDHIPIAQRMKKPESSNNKAVSKDALKKMKSSKNIKKTIKKSQFSKSMKMPPGSGGQKWTTLEHNGVIFPPPYKPHGVKMPYNGQPVDLTPEQEEIATMFAVMKEGHRICHKKAIY